MSTYKYFVPMNSVKATVSGRNGQIGEVVSEDETGYMVDFGNGPEFFANDEGNPASTKREAQTLAKAARQ